MNVINSTKFSLEYGFLKKTTFFLTDSIYIIQTWLYKNNNKKLMLVINAKLTIEICELYLKIVMNQINSTFSGIQI